MGSLLHLAAGDLTLDLAPEIGGSIAAWRNGEHPVLRPLGEGALAERQPRSLGSYPLVPFSNRIADRHFTFEGTTYELPALMGVFAIHGAGWQLPWQVAESAPASAVLRLDFTPGPLWPFAFRAEQRFALTPHGLTVDLALENTDTRRFPGGFGLHHYFPRAHHTTLQFDAAHVWLNRDADMIPARRIPVPPDWSHAQPRRVGTAALDNCFAGWNGRAQIVWPDRGFALTMQAEPVFRHLVVYVPPTRDFFAVEPVTNMNDGINRMDGTIETGMVVLDPGARLTGRVEFSLTPV
jgi:aldose 1-epimerase